MEFMLRMLVNTKLQLLKGTANGDMETKKKSGRFLVCGRV